jgi:transcriptional enhancer factor
MASPRVAPAALHSSSPKAAAASAHSVFPSPTYSDSTLSSGAGSHLCTPESAVSGLPLALRKESLTAANARFLGGDFMSLTHDGSAEHDTSRSSQDSPHSSLAAALDFGMASAMASPNSFLGKRSLHLRNNSASRRHSVQPLVPPPQHGELDVLSGDDDSFDFSQLSNGPPGAADFLLSPPRLTVSLSSQGSTPTPADAEDTKRRRTSVAPTETPQRVAQNLVQQTPPNSWHTMQQHAASVVSSAASSRVMQTPYSSASSSTLPESIHDSGSSSGSMDRQRRRSIAGDCTSEIAGLTAGLTVPSGGREGLDGLPEPPRSAPPVASESAMQEAQNKAMISKAMEKADLKSKGPDVWPDDVEVAFWEALRLIPKLGRRKVLVHGKPCGRNELIADYIERKTNKTRTRKQVSSHIQVLKNIKKGDPEFQQLIAEPTTEEDFYIPAGGMMYAQTLAGYGYGGLGGPHPLLADGNAGLLSPYTPNMGGQHLALHSPMSSLNPSPAFSTQGLPDVNGLMPPPHSATGLSSALNALHFPAPHDPKAATTSCPILPASFSMWVHCSASEDKHVYTNLDRKSMASCSQSNATLPRLPLDSVRIGAFRFPRLAEMYHHLPCQFLYVHVPMSIPRADVLLPRYDHFSTQLALTSLQESRLTSVTTVYSHGKRVLSLVEPLDAPRRISGKPTAASGNGNGASAAEPTPDTGKSSSSSGESSPPSSMPATPGDAFTASDSAATAANRHRFWHQAPFATDFWADFLSRNHPVNVYTQRDSSQSFGKEPSERAALGMAVSGVTIIQEFVVTSEDNAAAASRSTGPDDMSSAAVAAAGGADGLNGGLNAPLVGGPGAHLLNDTSGSHISPGSKVGDVVLVIAWDLECVESLGGRPGTPTVSMLTAPRMSPSPMGRYVALPSPQGQPMGPQHLTPVDHRPTTPLAPPQLTHTAASPMQPAGFQHHPQQFSLQQQHQQQQMAMHQHHQQQQQMLRNQQQFESQGPTLLRKRGFSVNKPNLMVSIPPVPSYLNGGMGRSMSQQQLSSSPALSTHNAAAWGAMQQRGMMTPVTPFPQLAPALHEPPPIPGHDETKAHRERLARAWAAQSGMGSELNSPLDLSFGHSLPQQSMFNTDVFGPAPSPQQQQQLLSAQQSQQAPPSQSLGLDLGGMPGFEGGAIGLHFDQSSGDLDAMLAQVGGGANGTAQDALAAQDYIDSLLSSMGGNTSF